MYRGAYLGGMIRLKNSYDMIIKIRAFEETILSLFEQNRLSGTTHTYIGEEATAAALMNYVTENDTVFSNHRCHGHYLAYGGPEERLLAEIMSKESGLCHGKGGSQHIRYKNFFSNGIQGGIVPDALGVAFSKKLDGKQDNTIVFLGDGTLGQGVVYESLNIASIFQVPIIFVVEDNQYAMSTKRIDAISGNISERISSYGIKTFDITSTDFDKLTSFFADVFSYINQERKPTCIVIHNYRLGAHSKGDDTRAPEEIAENMINDPMLIVRNKIGAVEFDKIYNHYKAVFMELADSLENEAIISIDEPINQINHSNVSFLYTGNERCVERIRGVFFDKLKENKNIVMYGEDVCDPYGGAFKVTKGLSTKYKNQVFNMPISEACMTGIAVGMAMTGKIPVAEMMFGDFITLGFDQLLNHAVKYNWVYGDDINVPMIVRAPMGGKRGYGPTHSQSLEKYLIGIPLLKVLALSYVHDPAVLYRQLFACIDGPTVVIENKKLYAERIANIENNNYEQFEVKEANNYGYSTLLFTMDSEMKPDYVILTYGGMVRDCLQAAEQLMIDDEIQVDVIVLSQLSPLPFADLRDFLDINSNIVFVEEGSKSAGIGAEIIASCAENKIGREYIRIAAYDCPIPNGIVLENQVVPDKNKVIKIIRSSYYGN